jgi:hypothetical protein
MKTLIQALHQVIAGRQLVIIDVQKCFETSEKIVDDILDYAKGFDDIVYIYDTLIIEDDPSGAGVQFYDMFKKMKDSGAHVRMEKVVKQFGFLRNAMDTISEEGMVEILEFMLANEIGDSRSIEDDETIHEVWMKEVESSDTDVKLWRPDESVHIPDDLLESLENKVSNRPILVGGGKDQCLQEVYLLLKAMGKNPEINEKYTY